MRRASFIIRFALLLPLAACESTPTAPALAPERGDPPAFAVLLNDRFPFDFADTFVCTELVDFSGEFHIKVSETISRSGNLHFVFHINAKGTGVGQTSGATYQWNDNINEVVNDASLPVTVTALQTWKAIGQGRADNLVLKQLFHITINANGDLTVLHERFEIICK